jgi:flavin-dependent dehydrogenase
MTQVRETDVAIVGGGPAGSTVATLLRRYRPHLDVTILEKEHFPREHVGESQLPSIGTVLSEMGAWDKVEAANFPIKLGASYTWGRTGDRWDIDFYPAEEFRDEPRPARFEGQRRQTAFQVDRAIYDDILLRHAQELGARVVEGALVEGVEREGDRVLGLKVRGGDVVRARHYVDASGQIGFFCRALDVGVEAPEQLRNIAIWGYWRNAAWAIEIGVGGTRVQVRSLPYGWIWFIPLGPDRTSIGLVCPAEHYRSMGVSTDALYRRAVAEQPEIASLLEGATMEEGVRACRDWSQLSERLVGENWFLAGDSSGFADPILAAGLSLAHAGARDVAYTILELERGELDPAWLRSRYDARHRTAVGQHIRFAQYWYSANSCFTDLQAHCKAIAAEAGLSLSPRKAWQWLSQGGFTSESVGLPALGGFDVSSTRQLLSLFDPSGRSRAEYRISGCNEFRLNLANSRVETIGDLREGRIHPVKCHVRGASRLPLAGFFGLVVEALERTSDGPALLGLLRQHLSQRFPGRPQPAIDLMLSQCFQALEVMAGEYWVICSTAKGKPVLRMDNEGSRYVRPSEAGRKAVEESGNARSVYRI